MTLNSTDQNLENPPTRPMDPASGQAAVADELQYPDGQGHSQGSGEIGTDALTRLTARNVSAWFGDHKVLERVSLIMEPGKVTALIGPSGCGKSTFLRILNRMHEMVRGASLAGQVLLDDADIYDTAEPPTEIRRRIGMVFQKPNPFPAISINDNVASGLQLAGVKRGEKNDLVLTGGRRGGLCNGGRKLLRTPGW